MQRTYHLLALLLLAQLGFGQDWRPLHSGRTAYYAAYYSVYWGKDMAVRWTLQGSRVDGADSIWYPEPLHPIHHSPADSCYGLNPRTSPLGDSIRVFANGDMDFYFAGGDTLHWKADLTMPWVMLRNPLGVYPRQVIATPGGYYLGTVLGQPDSILNLNLTLVDSLGVTSQRTSRLSKHHGWLDPIFRISDDAEGEYNVSYIYPSVPLLRGITHPSLGIQNLPKEAFFSMQPGDTLQILEHRSEDLHNEITNIWQQDIYLARTMSANGDTIFFTIDRAKYGESNIQALPPPSRAVVIDTIPLGSPQYQRLDRDLGEIYAPDFRASAWVSEWRSHRYFDRLMKPMSLQDTLNELDTCYKLSPIGYGDPIFWRNWLLKTYMEGLGGPYWHVQFGLFDLLEMRDVTYFHTATGQGGSRIDFDSLMMAVAPPHAEEDELGANALQVSPNPSDGQFSIQLSGELSRRSVLVSILAADGRTCMRMVAPAGGRLEVDAHDLSAGLYLVRVESKGQQWTRRIVIQ